MGVNNKQRRAAKAKQRAKRRAAWAPGGSSGGRRWDEPRFTPGERVRGLLQLAASAAANGDERFLAEATASLSVEPAALVNREAEGELLRIVAVLWDNGWQPAELVRHARRGDARSGRLVATAVAADHARRDVRTLDPRWASQVADLGLPAAAPTGWLPGFAAREMLARRALVAAVVAALAILRVGPLRQIIPPPGASASSARADRSAPPVDDPVLSRVRALLAQAESTTFEAEAEAFTAKAQELMAKHAIDVAVLWAHSARDERPTAIRLPIDDPYADIKSLLLQFVAQHSRCRAVFHSPYSLSTVVGFASDVAAAEMLFTSLLVQSQTALRAEAAKGGPGSRVRSRSFRASFLLAYTYRINERLGAINAAVEHEATAASSESLLPVLAARDDAVDDVVAEMFGELQSLAVRGGSDAAGWARGRFAADLAQLNFGDLDDSSAEADAAPTAALGA
jgi:hypothetical protein